jgi:kynurenine formamidase
MNSNILDLSHILKNNITVYPNTPEPSFKPANTIESDGFAEININMSTHTGTHIDAPAHILANTKTLDQFGIEKFIGPGLVLDCTHINNIDLQFLKKNEAMINGVDFILFYTGWQHKWNSERYFEEFPILTKEAVDWLSALNIKALGFDTISVDKMTDESLPNHHVLLNKEILIIENMTNLDKLISKSFELNCIPLKIENSDGSPIRAFARIKDL